jgi:hypothetical protein
MKCLPDLMLKDKHVSMEIIKIYKKRKNEMSSGFNVKR